ncbi:hypothetical protein [Rhodoferax bucti]|uniref:hypothetical protein n=1 Tax=Rhodoferax bucti TaxID=2576305 RepID=UPI00110964B7|nr:hypothetical protein [Rhodoferax bucti]
MRLTQELSRLYRVPHPAHEAPTSLVGADGHVRALVLEIARPADWAALSAAWQGAQADLELPAAAIAVSGTEGLQLWFSVSEPVPVLEAAAFLQGLHRRYLPGVPAKRVHLYPQPASDAAQVWVHAPQVPALQASGNWSAFISADLPAVFADEPWLDLPPNPEQQADILGRLRSITRPQFQQALALLGPALRPEDTAPSVRAATATTAQEMESTGPRAFLLRVMNDPQIEMQHRIEAAKVLLAHGAGAKAG